MTIDERLNAEEFFLPAIRMINSVKHATSIGLGLGELREFSVDSKITDALTESLSNVGVNYSDNAGLPVLRESIAVLQKNIDGFSYHKENIVITIGVQNAIYTVVKTLNKLGAKRILIPEINFGIYKKIPKEFGVEVVNYKLTAGFNIDLEYLSSIIKSDDIVLINSPANPTGRVFTEAEQKELSKLLQQKLTDGYVISDEIYGNLVYEGEEYKSFSVFFNRTIVVNGISKSAAAAGLRVGWIITCNKNLAKAFTANNATILSCPPTANQYAAIPVVKGETAKTIKHYNNILLKNRDITVNELQKAGIPFVKPRGSFYIFPEIGHLINGSVFDFCVSCAKQQNGVVVIPGEIFGAENNVRISLASMQIEEGIKRFVNFLRKS